MILHVTIEYNGDRKTFVKDVADDLALEHPTTWENNQKELIRKFIVNDFYASFNLTITNEKGEEF